MTGAPTVSVITSAYNGAALIGETIDSVLAQSFVDFEMIVVDDRSTDDTLAVLGRYDDPRICVVPLAENVGPVRARNHAFSLARGRYVAGLDQDDLCRPERLARQVACLDEHPDIVLVAAAAELLEDGRLRPPPPPGRTDPALIRFLLDLANPLVWSSVMVRGEAARSLDVFTRPERTYAEDFDLYHRLARIGRIGRIDEPLLAYRCHAGGVSRLHADRMTASAARVLAEAHAPLFGDGAEESAMLAVRHFAGKLPAPDVATLARIALVLDRLLEGFVANHAPDAASLALIGEEASRRWWELVRTSVRSGSLSRRDALSVRPASPLIVDPRHSGLLKAELVGRARALRQRLSEEV